MACSNTAEPSTRCLGDEESDVARGGRQGRVSKQNRPAIDLRKRRDSIDQSGGLPYLFDWGEST